MRILLSYLSDYIFPSILESGGAARRHDEVGAIMGRPGRDGHRPSGIRHTGGGHVPVRRWDQQARANSDAAEACPQVSLEATVELKQFTLRNIKLANNEFYYLLKTIYLSCHDHFILQPSYYY